MSTAHVLYLPQRQSSPLTHASTMRVPPGEVCQGSKRLGGRGVELGDETGGGGVAGGRESGKWCPSRQLPILHTRVLLPCPRLFSGVTSRHPPFFPPFAVRFCVPRNCDTVSPQSGIHTTRLVRTWSTPSLYACQKCKQVVGSSGRAALTASFAAPALYAAAARGAVFQTPPSLYVFLYAREKSTFGDTHGGAGSLTLRNTAPIAW